MKIARSALGILGKIPSENEFVRINASGEPYAGFDWETYQAFWSIAASMRERGTTILIISHFIQEQERFDQVLRLKNGTLETGGH